LEESSDVVIHIPSPRASFDNGCKIVVLDYDV
jgi:hypothetical protein